MEANLAVVHEAIAAACGDRECIVHGARRLTWAAVTERTRRLATYLRRRGLGTVTERRRPWESGQDHVGLHLYNGAEYLEAMLGAYKARVAPFNVNFRYVPDELGQLFGDARPRAVVYHASLGPVLALAPHLPEVLLCVDDGSGVAPIAGAVDYEEALASVPPEPPVGLTPDDAYLLYTGGTTGVPKGALWRQADIFFAGMGGRTRGVELDSLEAVLRRARHGRFRLLPLPPLIHGASQWMAFTAFHLGGTVVLPPEPRRFHPDATWATIEDERVTAVNIVGDAFGRPLLDALRRRPRALPALRSISNGGAALSVDVKDGLVELLPGVRILDSVGSSEAGVAAEGGRGEGFRLLPGSAVLSEDRTRRLPEGSAEVGWIATSGRVPLGYLRDAERTQATFPVVDGVRYAVPGDRVAYEADGTVRFLGRESMTVNTGGEKVFVEEVERALRTHPGVADVLVVGRPSPRWGQEVVAVVQPVGARPADADLMAACQGRLARYKWPKAIVWVDEVRRSPSGKGDYRWAKDAASAEGLPAR